MRTTPRLIYVLTAALLLSMAALAKAAHAHGDAEWIMNGKYMTAANEHCCGPTDCSRDMTRKVRIVAQTPETVTVYSDGHMATLQRYHGWYPSLDEYIWICTRAGLRIVCAFTPEQGA